MSLRRELDVQSGTENLRNLLLDIIQHPEVLTRARYVGQWTADEQGRANASFDSFNPARVAGNPNGDHIHPAQVRADLNQLVDDADSLRQYAERTRAHRTPDPGIDQYIAFRELHTAIADVRQVVGKYYALLTLKSVADWESTPLFDTIAPFTRAWVTDQRAVARAAEPDNDDR
jgi:hypothetical protein